MPLPHITFIGNPGVGKSSLLSALARKINPKVSKSDLFEFGMADGDGGGLTMETKRVPI